MKELFNVELKHRDYQSENKLLVVLVYDEQYRNGLFNNSEMVLKFKKYLKSVYLNLDNVEIFIMDNERILGSSIRFDKVFIEEGLPYEIQNKIKEFYNKAEIVKFQ